jgi:hypothetical protein
MDRGTVIDEMVSVGTEAVDRAEARGDDSLVVESNVDEIDIDNGSNSSNDVFVRAGNGVDNIGEGNLVESVLLPALLKLLLYTEEVVVIAVVDD